MDTNDLTEKAFESLLIAEEIDHMVTVSLGVMCTRLSSEDDFLREAFGYVKALSENPRDFLENWGLADYLDSWVFSHKMKKLSDYIREVMAIPIENRGDDKRGEILQVAQVKLKWSLLLSMQMELDLQIIGAIALIMPII